MTADDDLHCMHIIVNIFFFQAENGIRDLVRYRGLGVGCTRRGWDGPRKRSPNRRGDGQQIYGSAVCACIGEIVALASPDVTGTASYTHLTLPTIYSV